MIRGQVMLRPLGIEGIPIFNVENACASASSALNLGWQSVATGMHDVVLCLGAEKLSHDDKTVGLNAIGTAIDVEMRAELAEEVSANGDDEGARSFFMDLYADMARRYMSASGATAEDFAAVVVKNQHNGARNLRAQYGSGAQRRAGAREPARGRPAYRADVLADLDGAAAVVLLSERPPGAGAWWPAHPGVGRALGQRARQGRPDRGQRGARRRGGIRAGGPRPGRPRLRRAPRREAPRPS